MIYCRFLNEGEAKYGIVESHHIREISPGPFEKFEEIGEPLPFSEVQLLAPVLPNKIIAIGINYKDHAGEMEHDLPEEPLFFLKPSSAVIGSQDSIRIPKMSKQVEFEGELAVVISKKAKNVSKEQAGDYILGYTCFNDVTARDLQKKDSQWSRAKGFDTFAPIGPWIVGEMDVKDVPIETYLNGEVRQSGRTSEMIFDVPHLISYLSHVMTLEPGDVISTGTPKGVGPMKPGDMVDVKIEGIGILRNTVEAE